MKKSFYTIGSLIILLICAFVFVVLPAFSGAGMSKQKIPEFGKYNGKAIRYENGSDFAEYVANWSQVMQRYGRQIDEDTHQEIFRQAFYSTVLKMSYTDAVKTSGYVVPQTAINRQMVPYFADENGNYSSKLYKQTPASRITELHNDIESQLYASRYYDDVFGTSSEVVGTDNLFGLKVSPAELDFLSEFGKEKRAFKLAAFPLTQYPDEEKVAYGKENTSKFVKYDLSAITVEDAVSAENVLSRLNKNEITFEDAVTEYSSKNYTNTEGKLTYKWQYQIERNMLEKAEDIASLKALAKDSISAILPTKNGFAIFRANAEAVEPDFNEKEVLTVVGNYLLGYENTLIEDYFTTKAKEFTSQALKTSFDKACDKLNVTKVELDSFPLNFGNTDLAGKLDTTENVLRDADINENFLKTAFSLELNEISEPIILNRNVVVLQYTSNSVETNEDNSNVNVISNFDETSAQRAIMKNDKLNDHFYETYKEIFEN